MHNKLIIIGCILLGAGCSNSPIMDVTMGDKPTTKTEETNTDSKNQDNHSTAAVFNQAFGGSK